MNKIKNIDNIIIYSLLLAVLFLRYIKVIYTEWYIIDALILFWLFIVFIRSGFKIRKISRSIIISIFMVIIVIFMNMIKFGINTILVENLLMIFSPLTLIIYFRYLSNTYSLITLERLLRNISNVLNAYFLLNTILILIQINKPSFMMGRFLAFNPAPYDHMDGLIGMNGVAVLNFVWLASLMLNLYFYFSTRKPIIVIILLIQLILITIISVINDNKMFIFSFTIFGLIFFIIQFLSYLNMKIFRRILKLFFILIVVIISLYNVFDFVSETLNNAYSLLDDFSFNVTSIPDTHNERAYLNYLAFNEFEGFKLGIGLSNVDLLNQQIHVHLGINSSSLVVIQGGLSYLLLVVNLYSNILLSLFKVRRLFHKILIYLLIFISFTTVCFATQPLRDHYIIAMLSLVYFSYSICFRNRDKRKLEI